ncbi:MAG: Asp-tRNA(Asn)/Glu-tRNA(Gln) amidotransferase subunit GatC [Gammaproteobacteria bacterium]|nr:Asp-tRNA(Asn)/Glu-tRNA(Gln) amidotransferase subunit GatC [Gammaproteobacteria bacterium]
MSLSEKDIQKLGHLARIQIDATEAKALTGELEKILELVAKMNRVDTKQVEAMAHPLDETQPVRVDQVTEQNRRDDFMQIAPESNSGLYIVPKFVETEA